MLINGTSIVPSVLRSEKNLRQKRVKPVEAQLELSDVHDDFRVKNEPSFARKLLWWLQELVPLAEAFFVAVSVHVVAFPLIWFIGWALPWPKPPVITTIIEYDLSDWPKGLQKPKRIYEFRDPKLNP